MSTKEEIFEYVMKSPENTNPAVLKSMLDGIEGESNIQLVPINIEFEGEVLSGLDIDYYGLIGGVYYDNNHNIIYEASSINDLYLANFGIPMLDGFIDEYLIGFNINTNKNNLNILLNNEEVPFIDGKFQGYQVQLRSNTYPTQFNVSISSSDN